MDLQEQFYTQGEIAKELGVSRKTVNRYLNALNQREFTRLEATRIGLKAKHVLRLERIASEAYRAWERSQQDSEVVKTTEEGGSEEDGGISAVVKTETTVKGQVGNSAFLSEARAAMAEARKILGINGDEGEAVSPDDVRKLLDLLARVTGTDNHPMLLQAVEDLLGVGR